jgi:acyl carrier protein
MNLESWLVKWFSENTALVENEIINNLDENYLIKGWIDSLKFISFITDIENEFKISFSNDEFQNRRFATISGLAKIIEGKINERS